MATLQVKNLDDRLYKALGARAAMDNRSISQEIVTMLNDFLSQSPCDPRHATQAMLDLIGSWRDNRPAERIVSDLRKARKFGRRF